MKKLLNFVLLLTLGAMLTPLLTVGLAVETEGSPSVEVFEPEAIVAENQLHQPERKSYDQNTIIQLYTDKQVIELPLKDYLLGVLAAEMPASFPEEALKAQAVAARTYTLYKQKLYRNGEQAEAHHGADMCDDPAHCEAFLNISDQGAAIWGDSTEIYRQLLEKAVADTDGLILVYEQEPIAAVFCAAAGEKTESAGELWGNPLPYLVSVDSPGGRDCSQYSGTLTISQAEFVELIQSNWPETDFSQPASGWFRDSHRTEAGSILDVLVGGVRLTGSQVRQVLGLNSANFKVKVEGENLVFTTLGYGHGVGLSQYGARYFAMDGYTYDQILSHYYPGTQLELQG